MIFYTTSAGDKLYDNMLGKVVGNIIYRHNQPCVITMINHINKTIEFIYLKDKITVNFYTLYIAFKSGYLPLSSLKKDLTCLGISDNNFLNYAEFLSWNSDKTISDEEHQNFKKQYGYFDDYCKTIREMLEICKKNLII